MRRTDILAWTLIALLPAGCTGGDADGDAARSGAGRPAPDGDAAPVEAPPQAPSERPDTLRGTILLEGMADSMTFVLYESPAAFPVSFSTYVPEDMAVEALGSGAGDAFRFVAEFGGVRNEDAFIEAFFFPAGTTEAEAREGTRMFAERRGIRERAPELGKRFPWSIAEYGFRQRRPDGRAIVGAVALGRHGDRFFRIALHYPDAFGDGFGPRARRILEAWRWTDDGGALGAGA